MTTWPEPSRPASITPASEPGALARAARSAAASTRARQSSSAGAKWCARTTTTAPPAPRSAPSSAPRATMSPRSVTSRRRTAPRNAVDAASDARLGARRRSTSDAISVVTSRSSAGDGSPDRPRSRSRPTSASPTRSSWLLTPAASVISARSSAGERAATASTALERSISTSDASSARAAALTTSGSPSPDSTASEIAESAPRSSAASTLLEGSAGKLEAVVVPEHGRADAGPGDDERGEDVDAQDHGDEPIAQAPVRRPGGDGDEDQPRDERDERGAPDDGVGDLPVGHGVRAPLWRT